MKKNIETCAIYKSEKQKKLNELKLQCQACHKCDLAKTRKNIVFSDGNPDARIILIGEAPGQNEDETGIPFVGRAGKLLDEFLANNNISRADDIYICNTVKCRPPANRVPTNQEKELCREYLDAQLEIIKPEIILLCGATAVKSMLETKEPISKIRGQFFEGPHGSKMMPIYHPSYLLRNHSKDLGSPRSLMNEDLKKTKQALF